jgi:DNA mismatch endonuclease (patch repair protein)
MDNLTKKQRRKNMQNIRSKNTMPEKLVMQALRKNRIYFSTHADDIEGKPDIVFRRKKIAVFIDSDFWHCHPKRFIKPKTNIKYWRAKIKHNRKRDKEVNRCLQKAEWKVIRLWEHDIKHHFDKTVNRLIEQVAA